MFWLLRKALKLGLLLVLALVAFVAWMLFWPAPRVPRERCPPMRPGCVAASGRVLYHTAFGPGRHAHVVLISGSSVTLPGIVSVELAPQLTHAPAGLGFGDWVSVYGVRKTGSHHEHDVHVEGLATTKVQIRCGVLGGRHICGDPSRWPHQP
jgi:hypothetical protein